MVKITTVLKKKDPSKAFVHRRAVTGPGFGCLAASHLPPFACLPAFPQSVHFGSPCQRQWCVCVPRPSSHSPNPSCPAPTGSAALPFPSAPAAPGPPEAGPGGGGARSHDPWEALIPLHPPDHAMGLPKDWKNRLPHREHPEAASGGKPHSARRSLTQARAWQGKSSGQ